MRRVSKGEFSSAYEACPQQLEGDVRVGGQDHFYLETQGCLVVPKGESNEMDIFASTQCVDGTQKMAAKALGVPANRISARVKRIGEGEGSYWCCPNCGNFPPLQLQVVGLEERNQDRFCCLLLQL